MTNKKLLRACLKLVYLRYELEILVIDEGFLEVNSLAIDWKKAIV